MLVSKWSIVNRTATRDQDYLLSSELHEAAVDGSCDREGEAGSLRSLRRSEHQHAQRRILVGSWRLGGRVFLEQQWLQFEPVKPAGAVFTFVSVLPLKAHGSSSDGSSHSAGAIWFKARCSSLTRTQSKGRQPKRCGDGERKHERGGERSSGPGDCAVVLSILASAAACSQSLQSPARTCPSASSHAENRQSLDRPHPRASIPIPISGILSFTTSDNAEPLVSA